MSQVLSGMAPPLGASVAPHHAADDPVRKMPKLLIVDDHALVRVGIVTSLGAVDNANLQLLEASNLAHLATRELVSISRFKSNRDYELEVNRRARGIADLRTAFADNVRSFDCAWYGLYEVTDEGIARFRANFERIRSC